ncbi:F-box/LRR-repeat protein 3-like [Lycium ferocissimum]|uniref:F-box/LRR-repeat protein 3-like n=1 Tax=Lycium ferocissimum TaxID=112874 RepID=UPI002814EAB7|nr:F-box/LRR-repeat protein 3-like [Lycium ferocissimum]
MAQECKDLPEECWELIFNRLHRQSDLESVSLVCKQFLAITNRIRLHLSLIHYGTLSKLIHRFPNLNSIDLSDFQRDLSDFHGDFDLLLFNLANCFSNLRQLDISNHQKLPVVGLKELKGLRVLKCSNLSFLRDTDLYVIADSFPFLEELDISYPGYGVTDFGIEASSFYLRNLRKINISGNYGITDRSLVALSMNCLNLQAIQVEGTSVTLEGTLSIQRACASLSWISVSKIHSGFKGLATSSRSLQTLEVSDSMVTDESLFLLATASLPLSRLSLTKCTNFTLRGISFLLSVYRTLKCLSLVNVKFLTDESMNDLSQYLQSLVTIDLGGCVKLTIYTFFTLARNCPSIEDVNMENTSIGMKRDPFPYGVKKPRIRSVCLAHNPHLNDDSLTKVALLCPNMESLNLYRCRSVTEAGIAFALEVCNHIRNLGFGRCQLIKNIGRGAELPNLEVINAAGSALSDEGLAMIGSRCSRLLKLNLDNCEEVTAEGIQAMVQNCKSLREVNLAEECLRFVRA